MEKMIPCSCCNGTGKVKAPKTIKVYFVDQDNFDDFPVCVSEISEEAYQSIAEHPNHGLGRLYRDWLFLTKEDAEQNRKEILTRLMRNALESALNAKQRWQESKDVVLRCRSLLNDH